MSFALDFSLKCCRVNLLSVVSCQSIFHVSTVNRLFLVFFSLYYS